MTGNSLAPTPLWSWFFFSGLVGFQEAPDELEPYGTLQDMIDRYGAAEMTSLTDRTGAGEPSDFVTGTALVDATNKINAAVAGRYQLPLYPVPGNVRKMCCDIARFYLWRDQASDAVTLQYKAAMAELTGIQNGSITLQAATIDSALTSDSVEFVGGQRTFDRDSLRGF